MSQDVPHLITHVLTTSGATTDDAMVTPIHEALASKDLITEQHLVDAGDVDAELLVTSQADFGIDLVGPSRGDYQWQAQQQTGYDVSHFTIDWEQQQATCPQGQVSMGWMTAHDGKREVVKVKFSYAACCRCPVQSFCTKSGRRTLTLRPHLQYLALQAARQREQTDTFMALRAQRAGIEGTHSQGVRRCGLRRSRSIGEPRTHLPHVATAVAMNLLRLHDWVTERPMAKTRLPPFAALLQRAA